MKILTKYILKEFIAPFSLGLFCFTFILLLDLIFKLTKMFVQKGVNVWYLVELLIYFLPATLVLTIPMATLVGLLLTFGRLSADNEITAMKASGIGIHHLLPMILLTSLGISIFDFAFMDYALPRGNAAYLRLWSDIRMKNPALVLEPGVVMNELEREGLKWIFDSKDEHTGRLKNVKIWDEYRDGKPRFIIANEAELDLPNDFLKLYDGLIYEATGQKNPQDYQVINFREMKISLTFSGTLRGGKQNTQNPRSMSLADLNTYIQTTKQQLQTEKADYVKYRLLRAQVEYHKKFAIPLACFVFGLIGVPLGIMVRRSGKMVGAGIGLGLIIVYYVLLQIGETMGKRGIVQAPLAIWMPNILVGITGIILTIRATRGAILHQHHWLMNIFPTKSGRRDDS